MRTTLTLDDDVASALKRLQRSRQIKLKALVNEALREGLPRLEKGKKRTGNYRTRAVSLGRCFVSLESVSEALSLAEGEDHR